jgi:hypothetical protein
MSRGEGAIRGKFRGILRGFNIRWATRLLRETPRADLFSVRAQRSSVGLLGQRQFFSPRKRRWAGARGRKTAAGRTAVRPYTPLPQAGEGERAIGRTAVRPYIPLPLCGRGGTRDRANRGAPLHPAATGGRGGTRDRANRRSPLHPAATGGRGAGGEGNTKCASSARSELNRCTLIIPIAEPKFTKDSS